MHFYFQTYTLLVMKSYNRNSIIISKHKRLMRLWQFFFTGWGLVMVIILVTAPLFTKQILWTPITMINMKDMISNQFKMTNASFAGTDKDNNPFKIHAVSGYQKYDDPVTVFLEKPYGTIVRSTDKGKITDNISANRGQFNHKEKVLTLLDNVHVDSSNGDKFITKKLVVKL